MKTDILNMLLFGSSFSLIVLALGYITEKRKRADAYSFSALCFLWGVGTLLWMLEITGGYRYYPHLLYINQPLEFFIGTLFYCRFMVMLEGRVRFNLLLIVLFLPGFLALFFFIPFFMQSPEVKVASLGFTNMQKGYTRDIYLVILYGGVPWGIFCALLSVIQASIKLSSKGIRLIMQKKVFVIYSLSFIILLIPLYAGNIMNRTEIVTGTLFLINCLVILIYNFEKRYTDFFVSIWKDSSEMRYKRSMIKGIETGAVIERIKELMELENLYLDETLSLQTLGEALGITPHQLSEILNTCLNTSFKSLVNTYRINAAKKLILEDENIQIIRVAYQCGFNTKNAFNIAFQKHEGMSPTEFRERHKKGAHVYKHGRQKK